MSKKHKQAIVERPLGERITKARQAGQTQQALDLARQYYKLEQTEPRRELLRQITLERGIHLHVQGKIGDAVTVYTNALALGGGPEFIAAVARNLAVCGATAQALTAMQQLTDPEQRKRILQFVADGAMVQGPSAVQHLPTELHRHFELVSAAFAHAEAGRDDDARTALEGIGLQSPFLEWKVFLRGLLAFYAQDNARAVENWQRLDPARLPSRLCGPMRGAIDPAFLQAQSTSVQQFLRAKSLEIQGVNAAPMLRELRDLLRKDNLGPSFRKAETALPILRRDCPDLVSRFVNCFFWAVVEHGEPEDIDRYLRVFGPLPGDRQAFRLEALALEAHGMWPEAHKAWKQFIDEVAANSADWPGEIGKRVQALIWARMADNADPAHRHRRGRSGNPLFDLFASHTAPLKPSPEQCLENAIKLAPDRLESYRALFEVYRQENKLNKAKKVGQELLKRFPDHAETLDALGVLCMDTRDYKKAQEFFEKAIQANPLDRNLRIELARSRQRYGLELTVQKKFDQAREQYDEALKNWDGAKTQILCQWAIAEIKADDSARADELIAQALAEPDRRLACRYALVGESVRAKLTAAQKKKIAQNLKDALAQAPTPAEILVLLISAAQQRIIHEGTFHGQKTQEKTILKFLESVQFDAFEEPQMEQIAVALETMQAFKPWMNCLNHARRRFLKNPFFRLSYVDYYLMGSATRQPNIHLAREHLDHARRLVQEMPRGERQQQYLDQIQDKEAIIAKFNARGPSMMDAFSGFFNGGFGPPFEDEDDFYDYEDED